MTRRLFWIPLAMALLAPSPASAAGDACTPAGYDVWLATPRATIVHEATPGYSPVYACLRRVGELLQLDDPADRAYLGKPFAIAGKYVAGLIYDYYGETDYTTRVSIYSLLSGARLGSAPADRPLSALRLTDEGTAVFISSGGDPRYEVASVRRRGGRTSYARGEDIDPGYLRVKNGRVYWKRGGKLRKAVLR